MKVAISSGGKTLESNVDQRFARCPYYIIYNTGSDSFEAIENESSTAGGGAGVRAAQRISDMGVEAVISGNIGPSAFRVLSAASVKIYSGVSGSIKDVVKDLKNGKYNEVSSPDVDSHFGIGKGN
jgi:predicted Fe-Mo cluster-binding NifX family protein